MARGCVQLGCHAKPIRISGPSTPGCRTSTALCWPEQIQILEPIVGPALCSASIPPLVFSNRVAEGRGVRMSSADDDASECRRGQDSGKEEDVSEMEAAEEVDEDLGTTGMTQTERRDANIRAMLTNK